MPRRNPLLPKRLRTGVACGPLIHPLRPRRLLRPLLSQTAGLKHHRCDPTPREVFRTPSSSHPPQNGGRQRVRRSMLTCGPHPAKGLAPPGRISGIALGHAAQFKDFCLFTVEPLLTITAILMAANSPIESKSATSLFLHCNGVFGKQRVEQVAM